MLLEENTLTLEAPVNNVNPYAALKDIDVIDPFTDEDRETLELVREVLRKRNAIDRFGITLLHDHFEVNDDEILLETCDHETRTLTIRPYRNEELKEADIDEDGYVQTNWRFDQNDPKNLLCMTFCSRTNGFHIPKHDPIIFN
ncbi:hypothetical protein BKI52_00650 [marine bacterium AO1-C]|nr:hypothetical protein BKI52_00650 [marine bacterium AO1-C]